MLAKLPEVRPSVFMSVPAYWEKIATAVATEPDPERAASAKLAEVTGGRLRSASPAARGSSAR